MVHIKSVQPINFLTCTSRGMHHPHNLRLFFWGRAKIMGGIFGYYSLEMKENFGLRALAVASLRIVAMNSWWVPGVTVIS